VNEILKNNGWLHYSSGCPCNGLPRYYKNPNCDGFICVTKAGYGIIKRGGVEIFRTKNIQDFENKLKELSPTPTLPKGEGESAKENI